MTEPNRRTFFKLAAGAAALMAVPGMAGYETIYGDGLTDDGPGITALLRGDAVHFANPDHAKSIGWSGDYLRMGNAKHAIRTTIELPESLSGKTWQGGDFILYDALMIYDEGKLTGFKIDYIKACFINLPPETPGILLVRPGPIYYPQVDGADSVVRLAVDQAGIVHKGC